MKSIYIAAEHEADPRSKLQEPILVAIRSLSEYYKSGYFEEEFEDELEEHYDNCWDKLEYIDPNPPRKSNI